VIQIKCINNKEIMILNDKYEVKKYRYSEKTKKLKFIEELSFCEDIIKRFS